MKKKTKKKKVLTYIMLIAFGFIMIYPLIWLFFSSFKTNREIFGSIDLLPEKFVLGPYINGWMDFCNFTFGKFMINSAKMSFPTAFFTICSSLLVAYGFARFEFKFKRFLFILMISTLMLPNAVIVVPRYLLFRNLGWLNTFLPFIVPAIFGCYPFFIFMMVQFIRGIPRELDESAKIDGCNTFVIFLRMIIPLSKPAIVSVAVFQFTWMWEDFFNSLIFITDVNKFTVTLALRMTLDSMSPANWNEILAMSVLSILPCVVVFFAAQKYFVEGIATSGIKG